MTTTTTEPENEKQSDKVDAVIDHKGKECPICFDPFITVEPSSPSSSPSSSSPYPQPPPAPPEECTPLREPFVVGDCGHIFCRECLVCHCKHAISIKDIPIPCPAKVEFGCGATLHESQVKDLLCRSTKYGAITKEPIGLEENKEETNVEWIKFQRFQQLLQDPSLLSCSKCQTLLSVDVETAPKVTCSVCGHVFCSVHGDAHPNMTCEEYASSKSAQQVKQSEIAILRCTKPCSHCSAPIQKEAGCDHIICPSCKDDMCFRCGTHIHLRGDMIRSCKNCQQDYVDHRHLLRYRCTLCLTLPIYIPFYIVHIVVVGVLALVTCGFCFCFGCGSHLKEKGENNDRPNQTPRFDPVGGFVMVLRMIFFPILDLANQCGIPCCCELQHASNANNNSPTFDEVDMPDEPNNGMNRGDSAV